MFAGYISRERPGVGGEDWVLPGGEQLGVGVVEGQLCHGEADEAQAHEDGAAPIRDEQCGRWTNQGSPDHADDEGKVVPAADALVEPLAVVVKDVDTPVTMVGVILVILGFQVVIQGDKQSRAL